MSKTLEQKLCNRSLGYAFIRNFFVRPLLYLFYRKVDTIGAKDVPDSGPVIFTPNHQNALMDALLVLQTTPWKLSNVFVARGDIFKKGFLSKVLRFLKILPAFRIRDGYENLGKNDATFEEAREVLETKNALCIFPEGNQGDKRRLQPLVKGIFRIAFSAQEEIGKTADIKIIPVGIDYSNRERFCEDIVINYGAPISVSEFMPLYKENPAQGINHFREKLSEKMHDQMIDLATETYYDCFETAMEVANTKVSQQLFGKNDATSRFHARRKIAENLVKMEVEEPEKVEKLDKICANYRELKAETKLTTATIEKPFNLFTLIAQKLLLLVTLPLFATGFLLNFIPFFLPGIIRKKMGVKYDGFFSSFDFVLGIIAFPIFYLIQTILFAVFTSFAWWIVLIFAVLQFILGKMAFCWTKSTKKYVNKLRCIFTNKKKVEKMRKTYEEINNLVIKKM
jgi:1-acyl-sn-glycerol-3-phosphate acyltransferase